MDKAKMIRKQIGGGGLDTPLRQNNRDSNLELFRVITMLLIIAHHYVVNSGLPDIILGAPTSARSIALLIFGAWGKVGINCFVLITGYFMCSSHITAKKYVKLILEIELYNIVFFLIFAIAKYETFSIKELLLALVPVIRIEGFTSCYLIFYLFIPFLNLLIGAMDERTHLRLLFLLVSVFSIWGTVPFSSVPNNYIIWFPVLYMIASYIRLYPKKIFERTGLWGAVTVGLWIISALSIVIMTVLANRFGKSGFRYPYWFVSDSNKILALALALSAFLFFKNLKIKHSRFINALGASTFGVLLIHGNSDAMRRFLWQDVLDNAGMYSSPYLPLHAVGSVIAIFIVCVAIDQCRILLLERPFFAFWDKHEAHVRERLTKFENRIFASLHIGSQ